MDGAVAEEILQLLRFLVKRSDDFESQLQQQVARCMRDLAQTLSVLETHGQAVNAISARLGATTGQSVVRAFKSCESLSLGTAASQHDQSQIVRALKSSDGVTTAPSSKDHAKDIVKACKAQGEETPGKRGSGSVGGQRCASATPSATKGATTGSAARPTKAPSPTTKAP